MLVRHLLARACKMLMKERQPMNNVGLQVAFDKFSMTKTRNVMDNT